MKIQLMIELSDETKKTITDQLADFRKLYPQFQWEKIENYNILVHSFGEFSDKKLTIEKIETALFDKNLFYLYTFEVALVIQNNITLYLDFRREKEIERISQSIKGLTSRMESPEKYVPRLTLAKYKIPSKQQYFVIKKRLSNLDIDLSFKVNKLSLFEGEKRIRVFRLLH
jgi:2'-5' RNA ligase